MLNEKTDIKSMTLSELEVFITEVLGEKKFRAKQIYEWMHVRLVDSFDEMTNLSKDLRKKLSIIRSSDNLKRYFAVPSIAETYFSTFSISSGEYGCVRTGCCSQ